MHNHAIVTLVLFFFFSALSTGWAEDGEEEFLKLSKASEGLVVVIYNGENWMNKPKFELQIKNLNRGVYKDILFFDSPPKSSKPLQILSKNHKDLLVVLYKNGKNHGFSRHSNRDVFGDVDDSVSEESMAKSIAKLLETDMDLDHAPVAHPPKNQEGDK